MRTQPAPQGESHSESEVSGESNLRILAVVASLVLCLGRCTSASASLGYLVSRGQARAAIVTGQGEFYQFVGQELQRYFEAFSGTKLEILSPEEARKKPKDWGWILVGGPQANELVREAALKSVLNFEGLKADGFILRTLRLEGRQALVAGGNEEAATMYAAYDLLERYGAEFLLTGEILPERKTDLELPELNVRGEPAFRRRGLLLSFNYPNESIMSVADWQKFLDQMARMKMNYLHLFLNPYEPWVKYEYRGEPIRLGDVSRKDTGYLLWAHGYGSSTRAI